MAGFDDLIRRAEQIAREEGLLDDSGSHKRDILPRPDKLSKIQQNAPRAAQRFKAETGVDLTALVGNAPTKPIEHRPTDFTELPAPESVITFHDLNPEEIIQEQLNVLDRWVEDNNRLARKDFVRFWILKTPALICSVSVTAFESFGYGQVVIILGVVTAFCVGIDAAFPGGRLHNAHKRAANDARRLQHDAIGKWRQAQLHRGGDITKAAADIIEAIQKERTRIDKQLTDAEASLGVADA